MAARYTIVQYVPDPVADERINIGVIAWDAENIRSRFLKSWRRASIFGRAGTEFVRDFATTIIEQTSLQKSFPFDASGTLDSAKLEKLIGRWRHAIQFTSPRGSLKTPDALLLEVAPKFLRDIEPRISHVRTRRVAAGIALKEISDAVHEELHLESNRIADSSRLIRRNEKLAGALDEHRFDVVLRNGKARVAVHALSFEIGQHEYLEREIESTAWTIDDVRKKHGQLNLAVFVLKPLENENKRIFARAQKVFRGLKADIVSETQLPSWARAQARALVKHHH